MNKTSTLRDFEVIAKLGEGSFSSVYKVRRYDDKAIYALKKVKMGQMCYQEKQNALNEVRILASITHPNIINYKEAFFDDTSETLCIVMEIAEEGDILKKINEHIRNKTYFKESEIWKAFIHMTRGLRALHQMTILHRDLKCANVFCTKQLTYKLGDLNVSKVTKKVMARTHTGTPYYTSPEVWKDRPYDLKCDIWSLACVIYEMAALKPPFTAKNLKELYNKIQKGIFDPIPSFYSDDLQAMINMCMKVNPALRPTTQEILNHPLVVKNTVPSELYNNCQTKKQCNLLKTIMVPKNLKSLKEALPASKYEIQTNFDKQVLEKKVESRLHSVRSLGRMASVETPKIESSEARRYEFPRPQSAQRRVGSAQRDYISRPQSAHRPESAHRHDPRQLSNKKGQDSSNKKVYRPQPYLKNQRNESWDNIRRQPSREAFPRNRSRQALQEVDRNRSREIKQKVQRYIKERNSELKRNQQNRDIITDRRPIVENIYKPRSQSFEKENRIPTKKPVALPTENKYVMERRNLPPRQLKM